MLFYPADAFLVSRPNTSSTYQKVERRTIHSDDYQEIGSTTKGSSLIDTFQDSKRNVTQKEDYHFFLPLGKKPLLMFISQISFCLNTERQSSSILLLVTTPSFLDRGIIISGACVSLRHLVLTLFWAYVDGTLTYAALPAGVDLTDRQQKWKLLDKRILGLIANTIDDLLLFHVIYDWTYPLTFPSISKRLLGQAKDFLWHHRLYKPSFVYSNKSHSNTFALNMLR